MDFTDGLLILSAFGPSKLMPKGKSICRRRSFAGIEYALGIIAHVERK
jgi:hypothetical protein